MSRSYPGKAEGREMEVDNDPGNVKQEWNPGLTENE